MSPVYWLGGVCAGESAAICFLWGVCVCVWGFVFLCDLCGWVCGGMFSVGWVGVYVGWCFCVYSNICLHVSACGCFSFGNLLGNLDCLFCNE